MLPICVTFSIEGVGHRVHRGFVMKATKCNDLVLKTAFVLLWPLHAFQCFRGHFVKATTTHGILQIDRHVQSNCPNYSIWAILINVNYL